MPDPGSRAKRRWLIAAGAVVVLAVVVAIVVLTNLPHNVSHPGLSFTAPTVTKPVPPPKKKPHHAPPFQWPVYGYDAARTRAFSSPGGKLKPPLVQEWRMGGNALLEFPPVIYGKSLYFIDDGATVKEISATTGKLQWLKHVGTLSASSPAIDAQRQLLYVTILSLHGSSPGGGELAALSMKSGRIVWTFPVPAGTESSPLVYGNSVYFGDQAGHVYALNARNGHRKWTFDATGAVKGGPAWSGGLLYFGDYSGRAYAINALTGHKVWAVSTSGTSFGFGSGNFYSTPAVAFGRVYLGNTDGAVYSFAARTGQLAWRTATGAYVYASPAVTDTPGLGPTVYIGSYDGNLYAFNAQSGAVRWRHYDGSRISGAATVIDNVVYYSDLGHKTTTGLNARTGKPVFHFGFGAFTPTVADNGAIYLCGYNTLYRFGPAPPHKPKPRPAHAVKKHSRAKPHRKVKAKRHASSAHKHVAKHAARATRKT
jgi:outer membrane protein assembly factor BamB